MDKGISWDFKVPQMATFQNIWRNFSVFFQHCSCGLLGCATDHLNVAELVADPDSKGSCCMAYSSTMIYPFGPSGDGARHVKTSSIIQYQNHVFFSVSVFLRGWTYMYQLFWCETTGIPWHPSPTRLSRSNAENSDDGNFSWRRLLPFYKAFQYLGTFWDTSLITFAWFWDMILHIQW